MEGAVPAGLDDRRTVGDALGDYLRRSGLPTDSGVSLRWIRVRFLGLPIAFPNFDARRAILVWHDVHHLLTGYDTTWRGEGEIGAWELATGCRRYWAAWFFNLGGFLFGTVLSPRRSLRAFVRARRCTNYYGVPRGRVLATTVGAARRELGLDQPVPPPTANDVLAFATWLLLTLSLHTGYLAVLAAFAVALA